jgi:hypothetical protein
MKSDKHFTAHESVCVWENMSDPSIFNCVAAKREEREERFVDERFFLPMIDSAVVAGAC